MSRTPARAAAIAAALALSPAATLADGPPLDPADWPLAPSVDAIDHLLLHAAEAPGAHAHTLRPDDHAPIGVMGDHMHEAGEWMVSYRYMRMKMDENRDGTDTLSPQDVRDRGFMVAPTEMTTQMHMLGAMFAPTDDLTLMVMLPYIIKEMDHVAGMPIGAVEFTTRSKGIGDLKVTPMIRLLDDGPHAVHVNAGVSLPTGAINERDDTPAADDVVLPYPMQLGSGTVDLRPAVTYHYLADTWSAGAQASGVVPLGRNYRGYSVSDEFELTAWAAYRVLEPLSVSGRVRYKWWSDFDGVDDELNPAMVPTADPDLRGGQRLDLLVGLNTIIPDGPLRGHRFNVEVGLPVYQDLDGPQLEMDWTLTVGWQKSF